MHTATQAAELLGLSRQRVHYLIKLGRIKATRYGHIWMVDSLRIAPRDSGRPRRQANGKG